MSLLRLFQGSLLALAAAAAVSACRPKSPTSPEQVGKTMFTGVWLFGYDATESRQLTDRAKSNKGLIAVSLSPAADGTTQLSVLEGCYVQGSYAYKEGSMSSGTIAIKNQDELKAQLPFTYAKFGAQLQQSSSLEIEYRSPGDYSTDSRNFQLSGECGGATHVVTYLTVGAFRQKSGASQSGSFTGGGLMGPNATVGSSGSNEQTQNGGNIETCGQSGGGFFGAAPNVDCSTPLRVTLVPIGGGAAAPGGGPAPAAVAACADPGTIANQTMGFSFDGRLFVIERSQLATLDAQISAEFACTDQISPAENKALDGVVTYLQSHPAVRAHVSVACTPLLGPLLSPARSDLHAQKIMGKFASAGLNGRVEIKDCGTLFPVGNGVYVALTSGCSDHPTPTPPKCQ
ncbi:MAG: hypothetical protein ACXVEF_30135 [Polyangiales bacterium]